MSPLVKFETGLEAAEWMLVTALKLQLMGLDLDY